MLCGLFGLFESQSSSWRDRRKGKRIAQHTTYLTYLYYNTNPNDSQDVNYNIKVL